MAYVAIEYDTVLPGELLKSFEEDLPIYDTELQPSRLSGGTIDTKRRNSKHSWIPTNHWVSGLIWHHVMRANRENFMYDIVGFDGEVLQYTSYGEGDYYGWHSDEDIQNRRVLLQCVNTALTKESADDLSMLQAEYVRKLSFSLLLSDPSEFSGGDLQFNQWGNGATSFCAPREKGHLVLFDSRTPHRVTKVKSGVRKSLVGWVIGPRWK